MFLLVVKDKNERIISKYEGFQGFLKFKDKDMMEYLSKYERITLETQKVKTSKDDPEIDI